MSNLIANIRAYMQKPDSIGFWVECDGNSVTAKRLNKWQWEVEVERWNGVSNVYTMEVEHVLECINIVIGDDEYAVYNLFEPATKWSSAEVERFMAGLCPTMCKPYYKGFTLSAEGVETFTVEKFPFDFVMWRINGKASDFSGVLRATREKLAENVMWKHSEI